MSPNDFDRVAHYVREHLHELDDGEHKSGPNTVAHFAHRLDLNPEDVRRFRDGADEALARSTVIVLGNALRGSDDEWSVNPATDSESYENKYLGRRNRDQRLRYYDVIVSTRPEADSALTAWADMVVYGAIGSLERFGTAFIPRMVKGSDRHTKLLSRIADRIDRVILPDSEKHCVVRDMAKNGIQYEQLIIGSDDRGKDTIERLMPMPVRRVRMNGGEDPKNRYSLLNAALNPVETLPAWKVAAFNNRMSRSDREGHSIFESGLRSWIQIERLEAGMIIRRLERASARYKHILDGGKYNSHEEREKAIEAYIQRTKKTRTVSTSGDLEVQAIAMPPDKDFYVLKGGKDSPADVELLSGDAHLAEIADVIHFWHKWLSGLGPPKAHLGYESETMRSVISDLHIVFARKARRMQMNFVRGLNHLYWVELILAGVDPRQLRYVMVPPPMGTRDEVMRAQINLSHANTARALAMVAAMTGKMPNIRWFLRYVMEFDDAAIEALDTQGMEVPVIDPKIGGKDDPPTPSAREAAEIRQALFQDDSVRQLSRFLRFAADEMALAKASAEQAEAMGFGCNQFIPDIDAAGLVEDLGLKQLS